MDTKKLIDRCSVCGTPFEDTGKKQQCRSCGMFANLCCDPQLPIECDPAAGRADGLEGFAEAAERNAAGQAGQVQA